MSRKSLHSFFTKARIQRFIAIAKRHKAAARKARMARVYSAAGSYHRSMNKKRLKGGYAYRSVRRRPGHRHALGSFKTRGFFNPWYKSKFKR